MKVPAMYSNQVFSDLTLPLLISLGFCLCLACGLWLWERLLLSLISFPSNGILGLRALLYLSKKKKKGLYGLLHVRLSCHSSILRSIYSKEIIFYIKIKLLVIVQTNLMLVFMFCSYFFSLNCRAMQIGTSGTLFLCYLLR